MNYVVDDDCSVELRLSAALTEMNTMSDWLVINIESLEKNGTIMTTTAVSPVIMRHFSSLIIISV